VVDSILAFLSALRVFFRSRSDIALEVLALRQQVAVLKRKRPRPILNRLDIHDKDLSRENTHLLGLIGRISGEATVAGLTV
jgi:hypothetical protein